MMPQLLAASTRTATSLIFRLALKNASFKCIFPACPKMSYCCPKIYGLIGSNVRDLNKRVREKGTGCALWEVLGSSKRKVRKAYGSGSGLFAVANYQAHCKMVMGIVVVQ